MPENNGGALPLRKFVAPEIIYGAGAYARAGRIAANFGARKVLVVTDPGVIAAGWTDKVLKSLEAEGLEYAVFFEVTPNPRAEQVMAGAGMYMERGCNAILSVGGGSPMDCAKGIGIVHTNGRHIMDFEGADKVAMPGPPLICVPTTAGSSADVSQFAIIADARRGVKAAIISKTMVPDAALIDPACTVTMDPYLTACTGVDALTHAMEAYVSNASSAVTDLHALEAIRLVSSSLESAIGSASDIGLRGRMTLGSMYAGLAFSNASLGAVHAMAHSLGGKLDLAHGECNAILLRHVVEYNYESSPERYRAVASAMGAEPSKAGLVSAIRELCGRAGITSTLSKLGVKRADIASLAANALKDPCMVTNPRLPSQAEIERIYDSAF